MGVLCRGWRPRPAGGVMGLGKGEVEPRRDSAGPRREGVLEPLGGQGRGSGRSSVIRGEGREGRAEGGVGLGLADVMAESLAGRGRVAQVCQRGRGLQG